MEPNAPCVRSSWVHAQALLPKNLSMALNAFLNNAPQFSDAVTHYFNLYSKSGDINAFRYVFQCYFKFKLARILILEKSLKHESGFVCNFFPFLFLSPSLILLMISKILA